MAGETGMTTRYQCGGLILLRATTDPGDLDVPADLDLSDPGAVEHEGRSWLAKLWARDDAREALSTASPVLGARIGQLLATGGGPAAARDLRRAIMSAASYVLRWQRRATPFGLFAGILPASTGPGPAQARIGSAHRAVARAGADWVAALAGQLEHDPDLRQRL